MSRSYIGHRGVSKAVLAFLQANVPVQLAQMRAADTSVLLEDPKQYVAHERFSGGSGINKTTTPVVMVTSDGVAKIESAGTQRPGDGTDYDGPVSLVQYMVRVIVGVHAPGAAGSFQEVYDARSDLLLAVRNSVLLHPGITPDGLITASHRDMTELLFTPTDPETVRSYLEGQISFRVTSQETTPLPQLGVISTATVTVAEPKGLTVAFPV